MASDIGLHHLAMSVKKDARLIWINLNLFRVHYKATRRVFDIKFLFGMPMAEGSDVYVNRSDTA